jgi:hypothetical protein
MAAINSPLLRSIIVTSPTYSSTAALHATSPPLPARRPCFPTRRARSLFRTGAVHDATSIQAAPHPPYAQLPGRGHGAPLQKAHGRPLSPLPGLYSSPPLLKLQRQDYVPLLQPLGAQGTPLPPSSSSPGHQESSFSSTAKASFLFPRCPWC